MDIYVHGVGGTRTAVASGFAKCALKRTIVVTALVTRRCDIIARPRRSRLGPSASQTTPPTVFRRYRSDERTQYNSIHNIYVYHLDASCSVTDAEDIPAWRARQQENENNSRRFRASTTDGTTTTRPNLVQSGSSKKRDSRSGPTIDRPNSQSKLLVFSFLIQIRRLYFTSGLE